MKRRLFFCMALMLCCAMTMFAQNDKISYQAVVRGTDNHLVVNTDLTVTVSLANSENGPVVYKETHAVTSNMNGLISLLIGDGTPVDGSWADIQWSNAWVTAVINKGGTPVATHKMPLNAVPYALQAGYADSVNTNVIANYLATHSVPGVSNVQSDWNQTDESSDAYIKNKPSIRDSVSNYLTNNHYVTETVMSGAIHDSITNNISSQIHDSIANNITNNISSQIHDSLSGYDIKDCADVNACVANSLADGTSALNQIVDSIAGNTIHDSIVNHISTQIRDSVSNYLTNNHYVTETVMSGAIHDSIVNNIQTNINNTIHDSIVNNIAGQISDSLNNYHIQNCDDVNACVTAALADGTSDLNRAIDTIAGNVIHDSIANNVTKLIHDSIANNISSQIHDSITNLAGRIPAVNDATLTVTVPDVATTTFTANSATDATVTLAKVAGTGSYNDLTDTPTNLVTTDGDNTYTGSNDFTGGTVTVPSAGINLKTDDATSCSNQNAVNACDLLAVFDSLNRRIQGVFDSLKHLNDSLAEELAALSPTPTLTLTSDLDGGSVNLCGNASVEVVYTATLNNANAADYTFAWTVGGEAQSETGSTLTYTYTAAATDVKVVCVATRAGSAALKDSLTTTVKAGGTPVALGLCDNYLTVTVVSVSGSPNSISWGDGSTGTSVSADMTHTYSTSGTYTITATNSDGCKATYTMALAAHTTCTLSEMGNTMLNANERGSATAIDSVKDHEGNWYEVVQIGNQCWLKENLRTTTSPKTGTRLVNTAGKTGNSASQLSGSKVAHWYMNDSTTYAPKGYGLLYNWCAAMDTANPSSYVEVPTASNSGNNSYFSFTPSGNHRGICPAGWHLPSEAEWNAMEKEVSGESWQTSYETTNSNYRGSHAGKLSTGCDWTTSTTVNAPGNYSNAERNSSGFAAVPAGLFVSSFSTAGDFATFWSSSQSSSGNAWLRYLNYDIAGVYHGSYYKYGGRSVRCLRDEEAAAASAPSNVGVTLGDATANSLTATATADDNGSAITGYEYCISTNADMSGATCENATETTHTFTGLNPNTTYYVTVKATNAGGSTTSVTTSVRTPAHAPTATVNDPTAVPTGFKVEVTDIDPKEKTDATTVQVCYKKGSSCAADDDGYTCADAQTVASTETANTQSITGLEAATGYCVIVKVSNGDSTTVYGPYNVTTGANITLSITGTGAGTLNLCGGTSVTADYTATPSNGTEGYTYSWNSGTASDASTYTATYTSAGTYTVTCTATHTDGYTLTATATTTVNTGTPVTLGLCDNYLTVTVKKVIGNPNNISWGDGQTATSVSNNMSHTYSASGTYTITATNSDGCKATYTMELAEAPHTTCTLSEMGNTTLNANEHGSATVIDSVKDHEGNWYEVVQIGNQCWLKENLRTRTSPKTGNYLVNTAGKTGDSPSRFYGSKVAHWYMNDSTTYAPKGYGLLYNWCAAMDTANPANYMEVPTPTEGNNASFNFTPSGNHRGICPEGWHVPTDAEWSAMELEVNGSDVSSATGSRGSHAGKLSTGCDWNSSTTAAAPGNNSYAERNSSGFAAVPAGNFASSFRYAGSYARLWSSSPESSYDAWYRFLSCISAGVDRVTGDKSNGRSVRCLRD